MGRDIILHQKKFRPEICCFSVMGKGKGGRVGIDNPQTRSELDFVLGVYKVGLQGFYPCGFFSLRLI